MKTYIVSNDLKVHSKETSSFKAFYFDLAKFISYLYSILLWIIPFITYIIFLCDFSRKIMLNLLVKFKSE